MLCLTSKALSFEVKHITFLIYVKKVYEMKSMLLAAILYFIASMTLAQSIKLLMFEQDGCYWCEIWDDEISEIYPKTLEGHVAPLHRINIHSKQSNEIILNSTPQFTPTFIIINNNKEVGRIEGYPGDDFFWALIDKILSKIPEYSQKKGA